MKNRKTAAVLLALLFTCFTADAALSSKLPNIIIIFADDLGYADLGCYGHPTIRTPNLDRMAAEGMRFTDFYVAANVCTPSRAALLTGRLPIRSGMAGSESRRVLFAYSTNGLPQVEITIAEALKKKDYATACVGKWHLGHKPGYLPTSHGFDSYLGIPFSNDMEPTPKLPRGGSSNLNPDPDWWNVSLVQNEKTIEQPTDPTLLTPRYTEEAIRFIKENKKRPFFLYFAHTYPHIPLFASPKFKGASARGLYGDTVEEMDWSVGQVLETLRKEKLAENTLVFFTSDNGPWIDKGRAGGSAGLLRYGKGSTWEGGMRVPGIAWWPGKIKAGSVTRELACTMDLFNTCLTLAGVPVPTDRKMDGVDMAPILFQNSAGLRDNMFYYRGDELYAVRKGQYKTHFVTAPGYAPPGEKLAPQKHDSALLFNLHEDPSEKFDIAAEHANVVSELEKIAQSHRADLVPGTPQY
jgi:arylsulfatase A